MFNQLVSPLAKWMFRVFREKPVPFRVDDLTPDTCIQLAIDENSWSSWNQNSYGRRDEKRLRFSLNDLSKTKRSKTKVFFKDQLGRWRYMYFVGATEDCPNCVDLRLINDNDGKKVPVMACMKVLGSSPLFAPSKNSGQKRAVSVEEDKDERSVYNLDDDLHHKSVRTQDFPIILPVWRGRGHFRPGQKVAILWYAGRLWVSTRRSSRCHFICWTIVANLHGTRGHPMPFAIADPYGLGPLNGVAVVVVGYVMLHMSDPTITIDRATMTCTVDGQTLCTIVQPEQRDNGYMLVHTRSLYDAILDATMVPTDRYLHAMTRNRDVLLEMGYEAAAHGLTDAIVRFANMLADTDIDIEDYVAVLNEWALVALYEGHLDTAGKLFALGADGDLFADWELETLRDDPRIVDLFCLHRFDEILVH